MASRILNISLVLYNTPLEELHTIVDELLRCETLHRIYIIDNSASPLSAVPTQRNVQYIHNERNMGYGAAHNIALRETIYDGVPYHLVVNTDIRLVSSDIDVLVAFMQSHAEVGQLMPRITDEAGVLQHLCKRLPGPQDVLRRRLFAPIIAQETKYRGHAVWGRIVRRNDYYEMRDADYARPMNPPYLSGCFMLLRTAALEDCGIFDERYFMYPEDIDLTRRIHRNYLTLYYPAVTVIHAHRKASYHSLKMLWIHVVNMCKYFNKWGWWKDAERTMYNEQLKD